MLGKERLLYSGSLQPGKISNISKTIFPFQVKPESFKGEGMEKGKGGGGLCAGEAGAQVLTPMLT